MKELVKQILITLLVCSNIFIFMRLTYHIFMVETLLNALTCMSMLIGTLSLLVLAVIDSPINKKD